MRNQNNLFDNFHPYRRFAAVKDTISQRNNDQERKQNNGLSKIRKSVICLSSNVYRKQFIVVRSDKGRAEASRRRSRDWRGESRLPLTRAGRSRHGPRILVPQCNILGSQEAQQIIQKCERSKNDFPTNRFCSRNRGI